MFQEQKRISLIPLTGVISQPMKVQKSQVNLALTVRANDAKSTVSGSKPLLITAAPILPSTPMKNSTSCAKIKNL